jgi:hypothetical protein
MIHAEIKAQFEAVFCLNHPGESETGRIAGARL